MQKQRQTSLPHLGFVTSQRPLGAKDTLRTDAHTPLVCVPLVWARIHAHCELELLTVLEADMRDRTVLVLTQLPVGLQNIYINYSSIYCGWIGGQT